MEEPQLQHCEQLYLYSCGKHTLYLQIRNSSASETIDRKKVVTSYLCPSCHLGRNLNEVLK